MKPSSATAGFFQEQPSLPNQFHDDASFQRTLRRKQHRQCYPTLIIDFFFFSVISTKTNTQSFSLALLPAKFGAKSPNSARTSCPTRSLPGSLMPRRTRLTWRATAGTSSAKQRPSSSLARDGAVSKPSASRGGSLRLGMTRHLGPRPASCSS